LDAFAALEKKILEHPVRVDNTKVNVTGDPDGRHFHPIGHITRSLTFRALKMTMCLCAKSANTPKYGINFSFEEHIKIPEPIPEEMGPTELQPVKFSFFVSYDRMVQSGFMTETRRMELMETVKEEHAKILLSEVSRSIHSRHEGFVAKGVLAPRPVRAALEVSTQTERDMSQIVPEAPRGERVQYMVKEESSFSGAGAGAGLPIVTTHPNPEPTVVTKDGNEAESGSGVFVDSRVDSKQRVITPSMPDLEAQGPEFQMLFLDSEPTQETAMYSEEAKVGTFETEEGASPSEIDTFMGNESGLGVELGGPENVDDLDHWDSETEAEAEAEGGEEVGETFAELMPPPQETIEGGYPIFTVPGLNQDEQRLLESVLTG
jgi:hypothetical protein